jgi:integrase
MPKFHEGYADKLVVPAGKRDVLVFDTEVAGLGIRKFASGEASYILKYPVAGKVVDGVKVPGRTRRVTLEAVTRGSLNRVRELAKDVKSRARVLGEDLLAEREAAAAKAATPTLGDLVPKYLEVRAAGDDHMKRLRPKSARMVRHYLEVTWRPLHKRPIDQIARADIKAVLDDVARQTGKSTADRASTALSTLLAWCVYSGLLEQNPTIGLKAYNGNARRERVLTEAELALVYQASYDAADYGRILRLLILTGCRRKEIGSLSWPEVDLERRLIDLPEERTKNGRRHLVPLSELALSILENTPQGRREAGFIFGRDRSAEGFNGWALGKVALDKRIAKARGGKPLAAWTVHDIRRSVITHLTESRTRIEETPKGPEVKRWSFAQPHVVEMIVNHISGHKGGVAGVYNKSTYLAERCEALEAWSAHVLKLVEGRGKKVETRERARELA